MADITMSDIVRDSLVDENFLGNLYEPSKPENKTLKDKARNVVASIRSNYDHGVKGGSVSKDQPAYDKIANAAGKTHRHILNNKGKYAAGAGAAAAAGGAYLWHKHKQNSGIKGFARRNGKYIAGTSLAAIGAGVGAKALLKYLRKKKKG